MDTTPHWLASSRLPPQPALAREVHVDVAVIGGGITGVTAAYLAKKAGLTVALLERGRCGQIDTGHTTAHITAVTDLRLHQLQRRFGARAARAVWDAGTAALARIKSLVRAESIDCEFRHCPGYLHAATRDENVSDLQREAETAQELGIEATFVKETPFFRVPAVHFPGQAIFHPLKYLAGLLRAIPGGGSYVCEQTAAGEFDDSSVQTPGGRVHFQHLIIATHNPVMGESSLIGSALFQTKLSLYTSYALGARIPAGLIPEGSYWDTNDPYHYLRVQKGDGHDYAIHGGEDHKTGQLADTFAAYERLEAHLRSFAPTAEIDARWCGQVIETNDDLPFIGRTSDRQFIATGFSGNGMTFGTLGAMMALDAIAGTANPWEKLFDPGRTTILGGVLSYLNENKDFPVCLIRDHLQPAQAASLREIAPGEGKVVQLHGQKAAAYRDLKGRLTACSAICTHLQCVVAWNPAEKTWDCPCHGSRFQPGGEVISGPAEEPLPRLSVATGRPVSPRRKSPGARRLVPPAPRQNSQAMARTTSVLRVEGHDVEVSSLEKVLYPEAGFTKGDVINYYISIAPVLLPHLEDRALTMKRYPDGVGKFFFYEKNCPPYRPKWLRTARVPSSQKGKDAMHYCVVDTLPGLVWAANLADLELHVSLARSRALSRPTAMVFDLDPGLRTDVIDCARVAIEIRDRLARGKLQCCVKTSGSKGLQVYVPLNTPKVDFDRTKDLARQLAQALAADFPKTVVANMRKDLRAGKVFIDWSQNDDHKTTVCAYSLRATPTPFVSTPLEWKEAAAALKAKKPALLRFDPDAVLRRVTKHGDLFAPVLKMRQNL